MLRTGADKETIRDTLDRCLSAVDCCYLLDIYAYETTIHYSFNGQLAQVVTSP